MVEQTEQKLPLRETLYSLAKRVMQHYINVYLELARQSLGFSNLSEEQLLNSDHKVIVLGGLGSPLDPFQVNSAQVVAEWQRMQAVPFDPELAVTKGVYIELRNRVKELAEKLAQVTENFMRFDPHHICTHPYYLPILQRLANISSKAELKRKIGHVSDHKISMRAAEELASLLNQRQPGRVITRTQLLQIIEPTLEGIVRDLVGRVLLESIVANALDEAGVPYKRESEYSSLKGVVYDFRADFVIPDEQNPQVFIEVRKSSSRHASLYAKDKMFSAINWKGQHKNLLAVLVVDGAWTSQTLRIMTRVFDYITPINRVSDVVEVISDYIQGDKSKLKKIIDFVIYSAHQKDDTKE